MLQKGREPLDQTLTDIVALLTVALGHHSAAYASVPITSGRRLHRFMKDLRRRKGSLDLATLEDLRQHVIGPNEREASLFANRLRHSLERPVIDPSRFPPQQDWTQTHFNVLWGTVLRACCDLVVFADGWQYSAGCTFEFVVASNAGICARDAGGKVLAISKGIRLIGRAAQQLELDGLDPSLLESRVRELHGQSAPASLRLPPSAAFERQRLCRIMFDCITSGKSCVLIIPAKSNVRETPKQSTGRPQRRQDPSLRIDKARSDGMESLRNNPWDIVVDVAQYRPRWPRHDLTSFWTGVVDQHVHTLVVPREPADIRFQAALIDAGMRHGLRIVDAVGSDPLSAPRRRGP